MPIARILNLDPIIPCWREFTDGLYSLPTSLTSDILFLGLSLDEFRFGDEEKAVLSFYSPHIPTGDVHLFILCKEYRHLFTSKNEMKDSICDLCVRAMSDLSLLSPRYSGTILFQAGHSVAHSHFKHGLLFASLLNSWDEKGGFDFPLYSPTKEFGADVISRDYAHFSLKK